MDKLKQFRKILISVVTEGAELEGIGLTLAKTKEILTSIEKAKDKYSWRQIESVDGVFDAYKYVESLIITGKNIDITVFKKINECVDSYESSNAGHWRTEQKSIGGTKYRPPVLKGNEYASIIEVFLKTEMTLHNITKTFLKLCKTQCFDDGNKRTSLIFANALLLKHNLPLIRIVNNPLFKVRLVEYYDDDANIDSLIEYLITSSRQENIPAENELILTINAYLNKSGLTKYQLSKQTGVDRSYLTKIFNGKREPSVVVAKKLGSVLNFNWEIFFEI